MIILLICKYRRGHITVNEFDDHQEAASYLMNVVEAVDAPRLSWSTIQEIRTWWDYGHIEETVN